MKFNFLRGIGGEFEIGRVLLGASGAAAIVSPIAFQAWDMLAHAARFDVVAWCTAYPGGLAALSGIGVFAIGKKDNAVAQAKAVPGTSTQPTTTQTTSETKGS